MTTTFKYVDGGKTWTGHQIWFVHELVTDENIGEVIKTRGQKGSTWHARQPDGRRTKSGFRNREAAAQWLSDEAKR
jgi:hypothetical protein